MEALASDENQVLVSSVTPWEIAIKRAIGRLRFPLEIFDEILERAGFDVLPILPAHAIAAGGLERHHNDPFDRMLIGQALSEDLTLVTRDRTLMCYNVPIFAGASI
jgi:PIN domain nuclease of toxin-antitoxin system